MLGVAQLMLDLIWGEEGKNGGKRPLIVSLGRVH